MLLSRAMEIFVVIDTKGSGRVLGVFDSRDRAERFTQAFPSYYKLHVGQLNEVNPEVLGWADDDAQREALERLMRESG